MLSVDVSSNNVVFENEVHVDLAFINNAVDFFVDEAHTYLRTAIFFIFSRRIFINLNIYKKILIFLKLIKLKFFEYFTNFLKE